jgi:16S rRNA (guanine966-N2)-methyltransferase
MSGYTTRITAGNLRYKVIHQPGEGTRPVSQKVRQAILSVLGEDLTGLVILDLYAGSGALGFEALSRGAERLTSVEHALVAGKCLRANAQELGVTQKFNLMQESVPLFLSRNSHKYDIIFFDPPYTEFSLDTCAISAKALTDGGVLVVSCSSSEQLAGILGSAKLVKTREYGDTQIAYYKN